MFQSVRFMLVQSDRPLFFREYSSRKYGVLPFYINFNLVNLPYDILFTVIYTVIVYWPLGLNTHAENFFKCLATLILLTICAASFGIFVSVIAPNLQVAVAMAPV